MSENENKFLADMRMHVPAPIIAALGAVHKVSRFDMPPKSKEPFLKFHAWLTGKPESPGLTRLRGSEPGKDKYSKLTNLVLQSTQNTLGCVYYHRSNLAAIEAEFDRIQSAIDFKALSSKEFQNVTGGNTLKLDYEYQAFILAVRRCLEYFTLALATYFKQDFHSFNGLPDSIVGKHPKEISSSLKAPIDKHHDLLSHFYSEAERRSPRDQISHYGYVPAGVVNITSKGIFLAGGGEDLHLLFKASDGYIRLGTVIDKHLNALEDFLRETIDTLIASDTKHYEESSR